MTDAAHARGDGPMPAAPDTPLRRLGIRLRKLFVSVGLSAGALRTRVAFAAVAAIVLGLAVLGTVITVTAARNVQEAIGNQVFAVTANTATEIAQKVDLIEGMLSELAARVPLAQLGNAAAIEAFIRADGAIFHLVNTIVIYHVDGSVAADWPADANRRRTNYADREWMREVLKTERTVISAPFVGRNSKAPRIVIAVPVKDPDRKTVAIATATILALEPNFIGRVMQQRLGLGGFLLVADREGTVIAHPNPERIMKPLATTGGTEAFNRARLGWSGYFEGIGGNQRARLLTAAPIGNTGWILIGVMPSEEAYKPVAQLRTQVLLFSALTVLLVGIMTWFMLGRLLRPLSALRDAVERLGEQPAGPPHLVLDPRMRGSVEIDAVATALANTLETLARAQVERANLAAIVESSEDAIMSRGLDFRVVSWNAAAERMFGYSAEEVINTKSDFLIPADREPEAVKMRALLEQGLSASPYDSQRLTKDGRRIDVSISQAPIRDANGRMTGVSIAYRGITERKRAETALRESEERLRLALQAAGQGFYDLDMITGNARVSSAYATMIGYDPATFEETNARWAERLHPDDREKVYATYLAYVRGEIPDYEVEFRQKMRNGDWLWTLSVGSIVSRDAQGKPLRMLGIHMDISRRKQSEIERAQFAAIVESSNDAIISRDKDGNILSWNPAAERLFGWSTKEAVGGHISMFIPSGHEAEVRRNMEILHRGEAIGSYDTVRCRKNGQRFDASLTQSPIKNERGEVIAVSLIIRDITERKRTHEALKASLNEKETLLREIHHRVKNNLQIISSLLHFQARKVQNPEDAAAFEEGRERLKSMILVHEKLYRSQSLARIDFGDYVRTLAEHIHASYRQETGRVTLTVKADAVYLPIEVALPCGMLLSELISNVFKYAYPEGHTGALRILITAAEGMLQLVVADDGVGLPAEVDPRKPATFGMQLVANLAEQLGGEVRYEGGAGLTVALTVPLKERSGEADAARVP